MRGVGRAGLSMTPQRVWGALQGISSLKLRERGISRYRCSVSRISVNRFLAKGHRLELPGFRKRVAQLVEHASEQRQAQSNDIAVATFDALHKQAATTINGKTAGTG